ncbi:hypothetical protein AciM339_0157 [Aciduliprofundum sp. MAR08-339]|uniref:aconitase X swivel domain-containing protein n=1 Tax=Aciduliprofundum sp. (strain MAR08-339) TaxID=673860 RepID=UPI0002A4C606|nr:hypothetical protein AciM339_0157 [Aciduliprofundum sp. MAR08-339]
MILRGRTILEGNVEGTVVKFDKPIVILGDVNEKEGTILGKEIKGKIVVFPRGAGSTVGSYTIYGLKYYGNEPLSFILQEAETIVAAGAIMANIPTLDRIDTSKIKDGDRVRVSGNIVEIL